MRTDWDGLVMQVTKQHWREVFLLSAEIQRKIDSLILLMKRKVDAIIAVEKLQNILAWANQKSAVVNDTCKPSAIRAFYLSIEIKNSFDDRLSHLIEPSFNPGISRLLQVDHLLYRCLFHSHSPDFNQPLYTYGSCFSITRYLDFEMFLGELLRDSLNLQLDLKKALIKLKLKLPSGQERINYQQFWHDEGKGWTEELIMNMSNYCQIRQNWHLNNEQYELFEQYYNANYLLLDCLNIVTTVSKHVIKEVEEMLFLPIAEIDKRKYNKQIN
ncbi:hypothetical protein RIVM261_040550 [Rivularia sp. IAM M-261]|nr:hypothetical protein RIVM261_040550 [Rivularia sp. IAM M-261]